MSFFGIIPLGDLQLRNEYPLVKATCHYVIEDVYSVANLVQYYSANASLDRDVEYFFPLPSDAAVCAFKAIIDDTTVIKGAVKEKEEAKRDYQEAVAAGKYAGLLEKEAADGKPTYLYLGHIITQCFSVPCFSREFEARVQGCCSVSHSTPYYSSQLKLL
jgi:Vault protein inter-alpha-trypsin domain